MEEDNGKNAVAEDVIMNEKFSMGPDVSPVVCEESEPESTSMDLEVSQMNEEFSHGKLIRPLTSYPDRNELLLTTEIEGTSSQPDNAQPCLSKSYISLENTTGICQNKEQHNKQKKNSHFRGDIITLKILSDKAWENEKWKRVCFKRNPSDNARSSVENVALSRFETVFTRWQNDITKIFEASHGQHSCKKCEFIISHNFTMEDRLRPKGSNCCICSRALFHIRGVNKCGKKLLPVCNVCIQLMKHTHKHVIEDLSFRKLKCSYCAKTFEELSLYRCHIRNHRECSYKCSLCPFLSMSRYCMVDHIRLHIRDGSYCIRRAKVARVKLLHNLV